VGEGVHRGAAALGARELERQLRLVHDPCQPRACAAALHPAVVVTDAEEARPLGARVRRRHGDELEPSRGRECLGEVDGAAAAHGQDPVGALSGSRDGVDAVGRNFAPAGVRGKVELRPALAGDEERPLGAHFVEDGG
jgi:hypothetical protein